LSSTRQESRQNETEQTSWNSCTLDESNIEEKKFTFICKYQDICSQSHSSMTPDEC